MCICADTHAHFHTMHKRCLPRFGGPLRRAGLAGSGIVSGGPRRADDVKRQHVNGERSRHGSATFDGTATPPLMSHKVMFVLLGECVCGCLAVCGGEHPVRVILCVHVRACDGQRADIKCQRSSVPANPVWQVFLPGPAATVTDPSLYIPKMASQLNKRKKRWKKTKKKALCRAECQNLVTDEPADVGSGAVWAVIVPFHTRFHLFADHLLRVKWRL